MTFPVIVSCSKYQKLILDSRPAESQRETYRVIDTSQLSTREGLTQFAIQSIEKTLSSGKQALVFVNQRGFCPVLLCEECKQIATCDRCQVKLTYHQTTEVLSCHHCGRMKSYPLPCRSCGSSRMIQLGVGTERLEKFLKLLTMLKFVRTVQQMWPIGSKQKSQQTCDNNPKVCDE